MRSEDAPAKVMAYVQHFSHTGPVDTGVAGGRHTQQDHEDQKNYAAPANPAIGDLMLARPQILAIFEQAPDDKQKRPEAGKPPAYCRIADITHVAQQEDDAYGNDKQRPE